MLCRSLRVGLSNELRERLSCFFLLVSLMSQLSAPVGEMEAEQE